MAIQLPQGLNITSKEPVDSRLTLTKAEMLAVKAARMPDVYFAVCKDDGKMYIYNKTNEADPETGRFRVLEGGEAKKNAYDSISKVEDYLYETNYSDLDYDFANTWFKNSNVSFQPGACSSVRKGNWYGRNYDWFYNNDIDFIIKTPRMNGNFATIGIGGNDLSLNKSIVESGEYQEAYKIVPFKLLDGINEYGVFANTNVVPAQYGETIGTTPLVENRMELCNLALPRFILDKFKTANEAVDYIQNYVSVYSYAPLYSFYKKDIHVMVGDKDHTYIIEFVNNEIKIEECDKPIMTNFFRYDVQWNMNGSVFTPAEYWIDIEKNPMTVNKITSHGSGLERHNLINNAYESLNSKEAMRSLLDQIKFTNAYISENPVWYSECVGDFTDTIPEVGDLELDSSMANFQIIYDKMKDMFADRSRETGDTWHSVHSCVYDIDNRKFYLIAQESGNEIEVSFDYYTAQQVDSKFVSKDNFATKIDEIGFAISETDDECLILTKPR